MSDLVQVLIVTFGEQCPVYSTPQNVPQPRQWNQPVQPPPGGYPQQQQHAPYPQQPYGAYPRSQPPTGAPYPTSTTPVSFPMPTASELLLYSRCVVIVKSSVLFLSSILSTTILYSLSCASWSSSLSNWIKSRYSVFSTTSLSTDPSNCCSGC